MWRNGLFVALLSASPPVPLRSRSAPPPTIEGQNAVGVRRGYLEGAVGRQGSERNNPIRKVKIIKFFTFKIISCIFAITIQVSRIAKIIVN